MLKEGKYIMKIEEKISAEAVNIMKKEIAMASGNEVFFRGFINEDNIVHDVQVLARGNKYSVPAILKQMKKREVIIHNHPSGYLYPSDNDVKIAAYYSETKNGASYIVNNNVNDIYVIVELADNENKKIEVAPYFEEKGLLSQIFSEFEFRKEQLEMALHIENGLNENKKVIVEAGTGTGKTLAYLIPAVEWAVKNEKKVIVSTNTINLQEQLLNKDIPIVSKLMNNNFKYLLVKGRGNYLCNRKLINIAKGELVDFEEFTHDQKQKFKYIISWGDKTKTGDRSELSFEVEHAVWEHFASETDLCAGNKCPHKLECFFLKSREEKREADLLITNHHMYFADLSIRKEIGFHTDYSILPNYDLVIFDEAHNIENVARDYFSYEVSKYGFNKSMNYIYNLGKKKKKMGSLNFIKNYLKNIKSDLYKNTKHTIEEELVDRHIDLSKRMNDFFTRLIDIFSKGQQGTLNLRLKKSELEKNRVWSVDIQTHYDDVMVAYNSYIKRMRALIRSLKELDDEDGIINDFSKYVDRIEAFFLSLKFINDMDDENYIYWLSMNVKKNNLKLIASPLKIHNELEEALFNNLEDIIFTSATIAVEDSFDYFKKSIGLNENTHDKVIHSPFDYENQMRVYVPTDTPMPNDKNFISKIQNFVKNLIIKARGNTFILFTSYSTLNYLYYLLNDDLEARGFDLFIQGMAPRNQLINMYKTSRKPVLFGTDSFWEGVDVKGEKLSSVIMVKLPFKVPSEPVVEAIIENLTKEGKNAFMEYQIPESIIKFKQGVGRLIRSKEDKGIITILDNRLISKRYGRLFLNSLPTSKVLFKKCSDII